MDLIQSIVAKEELSSAVSSVPAMLPLTARMQEFERKQQSYVS
jgi:hypothetical protein